MAVITYQDVATAIGRPIVDVDEQAQVTQWIADVELVLGARLDLDALDDGVDDGLLAYVVREAVIGRMRHRSEDSDEGNEATEDNWVLRVLDPWWALLDPGETGSAAFSARPYFEADDGGYSLTAWETA